MGEKCNDTPVGFSLALIGLHFNKVPRGLVLPILGRSKNRKPRRQVKDGENDERENDDDGVGNIQVLHMTAVQHRLRFKR